MAAPPCLVCSVTGSSFGPPGKLHADSTVQARGKVVLGLARQVIIFSSPRRDGHLECIELDQVLCSRAGLTPTHCDPLLPRADPPWTRSGSLGLAKLVACSSRPPCRHLLMYCQRTHLDVQVPSMNLAARHHQKSSWGQSAATMADTAIRETVDMTFPQDSAVLCTSMREPSSGGVTACVRTGPGHERRGRGESCSERHPRRPCSALSLDRPRLQCSAVRCCAQQGAGGSTNACRGRDHAERTPSGADVHHGD